MLLCTIDNIVFKTLTFPLSSLDTCNKTKALFPSFHLKIIMYIHPYLCKSRNKEIKYSFTGKKIWILVYCVGISLNPCVTALWLTINQALVARFRCMIHDKHRIYEVLQTKCLPHTVPSHKLIVAKFYAFFDSGTCV